MVRWKKLEKLFPKLIAALLEKTLFDYLFCIRQDFKSLFTLAVRNISVARHRKVFCNRWVKIYIFSSINCPDNAIMYSQLARISE
jgi:hypothetical protein